MYRINLRELFSVYNQKIYIQTFQIKYFFKLGSVYWPQTVIVFKPVETVQYSHQGRSWIMLY